MKRGFAYILLCIFIAITALIVLSGSSEASAEQQTVPTRTPPPPDWKPRAYLPIITNRYFPTKAYMSTELAVVDVGDVVSAYLYGTATSIWHWNARIVWPQDMNFITGHYLDGFWSEWIRWDVTPFVAPNYTEVEQMSGALSTQTDAEMYRLDFTMPEPYMYVVCAEVAFNHQTLNYLTCQEFLAQECATDYNKDGIRDINDIMQVSTRIGCEKGDACYSFQYDLDGNGVINNKDGLLIASVYWNVPCP